MIPQEAKDIVDRLLVKTRAGEVQWKVESETDFIVTLPEYSVAISYTSFGVSGATEIMLSVFDNRGYKILSFAVSSVIAHTQDDYKMMTELYDLARAKALNIVEALKTLREQIGRPGIIGSSDSST